MSAATSRPEPDGAPAAADVPGGSYTLQIWRDRLGRTHEERRASARADEPRMPRVTGPLERAWMRSDQPASLRREALARPNPFIESDSGDPSFATWTWVIEDADARAVVLWTNPVFDHSDVGQAEFTRLPGSDLWTICLHLPASLRASYRVGVWRDSGVPPWRTAAGRREAILRAMGASGVDARCVDSVQASPGETSSVGAGPLAPPEVWRGLGPAGPARSRVDGLTLPHGEQAWVYAPESDTSTPLLVLFDGRAWLEMGLPAILDAAIARGVVPPVHVAMLDSGERDYRWAELGVPGGQVDTVIDELLPRVREQWEVDPRGSATLVSGQSLGGIASLWTLALSGGEVQHAIAQSPSLWRFDVAEALLAEPGWASIELEAGTFEGDMLADARALAKALRADGRLADRSVRCTAFEAGHDWAVWRANLLSALSEVLPRAGARSGCPDEERAEDVRRG